MFCVCHFNHAKECLNHPDTFFYVCDEVTFKSQKPNFTPLIKKCMRFILGVECVTKIKVEPVTFVV